MKWLWPSFVCAAIVGAAVGDASPSPPFAFVPDAIANQVGDANVVVAIDFSRFDAGRWLAMIPDRIGCVRDLVKSTHVIVVVGKPVVVYATGLSQPTVWRCLHGVASLFPDVSATRDPDGSIELQQGQNGIVLAWRGDVATIRELGAAVSPSGPPSAALLAAAGNIPPDVTGFLVGLKSPQEPLVENWAAWLRVATGTALVTLHVNGTKPGAARTWLHDLIDMFKAGATARHFHIDDSWFHETDTDAASTLEVRVPLTALPHAN